ncbi:MAG: DUF3604 domain-containing protein [Armatimonadota bacterium]
MRIYWGDMHTQFNLAHMRLQAQGVDAVAEPPAGADDCEAFVRRAFEGARDYLDFFPIVYYPAHFVRNEQGFRSETVGWKDYYVADWAMICRLVREYHEPGRFVTFAGYEWSGDRTRWGDHNVFYPFDDPPLDLSLHIDELYANLRARGGIAIPHHTAYAFANRGKDWAHFDEQVSPFAEIYSVHGSSEGCGAPLPMFRNGSMAPRVSMNTIQSALNRGLRLGIIASGDNGGGFAGRWGIGLMAAIAPELTRESLWEAFLSRRVYGVTGDRIKLDYSIDDAPMGSTIERPTRPLTLRASVECTEALDRIEVIRNGRVAHTHCHAGTWEPPDQGTVRCKLPLEFGWGPTTNYGLAPEEKRWHGRLRLREGRIISVEGAFTRHGNSWRQTGDGEVEFDLTTSPRGGAAEGDSQARLIVEIEAPADGMCVFECDHHRVAFTPAEAMRRTGLIVYDHESRERITAQFGPQEGLWDDLRDAIYHNAHIIKRHLAIPHTGYTAAIEVEQEGFAPGRNYLYLRVSQLNGQYAWSSPIWIDA